MIIIYNATLRPDVFYHKLNIFLFYKGSKMSRAKSIGSKSNNFVEPARNFSANARYSAEHTKMPSSCDRQTQVREQLNLLENFVTTISEKGLLLESKLTPVLLTSQKFKDEIDEYEDCPPLPQLVPLAEDLTRIINLLIDHDKLLSRLTEELEL